MNNGDPAGGGAAGAVRVNMERARRIEAGHLWAYDGDLLDPLPEGFEPGSIVDLRSPRGGFLARGYANPRSRIVVRVLSRARRAIDAGWVRGRIDAALAYRMEVMPGADAVRLVASEADFLPGLIVDRYGGVLVVQALTRGMVRLLDLVVDALAAALAPEGILLRNDVPSVRREGMEPEIRWLRGSHAGPVRIARDTLRFEVDVEGGPKTGLYLDQQRNWDRVAAYAAGRRVLDAFCAEGAFGLHAAAAGAASVEGIDLSPANIEAARRAAEANGLAGVCRFEAANAFDVLRSLASKGACYDLIVLDPPSFTRSRARVPEALRGYKEIALRAFSMLRPGGLLATFTCSHHVEESMFLDVTAAAAADAGRRIVVRERLGPSPDHPFLPAMPETRYLKGFLLQVRPGDS